MTTSFRNIFRSLRIANYRLWAGGALVSNVGTWMQRIAQDWLVLTILTPNNATSVGIVMALQFGPALLFLPLSGYVADRFDLRRTLQITQGLQCLLALGLGLLTITGIVTLYQVYVFAFLLGAITAFDAPARQAFVSELVGEDDLSNAVALNSTSFNAARMLGPAVAGGLIAVTGPGWVFLINAASFAGVLSALGFIRPESLVGRRKKRSRGGLLAGFRYVLRRGDLIAILCMLFLFSTFGLNFPIFISTMSVKAFHVGAGAYGVLTSMLAVGTLAGALFAASRAAPKLSHLISGAFGFGLCCILAALMPHFWLFGAVLIGVGLAQQTFMTSANSLVQLSTHPAMRGRIMALYMGISMGGTPVGGPVAGYLVDTFGPRWTLGGLAGMAGLTAALIGYSYCRHSRKRLTNMYTDAGDQGIS